MSEKLATDSLNPSALKREFVSILHLLEEKNFRGVKINLTHVLEWFAPAMNNYCDMFDMTECKGGDENHDDDCQCHRKNMWCLADQACGLKGKYKWIGSIFMVATKQQITNKIRRRCLSCAGFDLNVGL